MARSEERSETERHWDIIAGTSITASTAAAAVFLIVGNGQQEPDG